MYSLIGETPVTLPAGENGLYIVDAGDIQVEPDDVIGVQFVSGSTLQTLCETTLVGFSSAGWAQNILTLTLPAGAHSSSINVTNATWMDSIVCQIQAMSAISKTLIPPSNIVDGRAHGEGEYTYRAEMRSPLADTAKMVEANVTMQWAVQGLVLANPEQQLRKTTPESVGTAVVPVNTLQHLVWRISKGTDVLANWTISEGPQTLNKSCPLQIEPSIRDCQKNYQFLVHPVTFTEVSKITTFSVTLWNEVSEKKLTVDILAQEIIESFTAAEMMKAEFQSGTAVEFSSMITAGSEVKYQWIFGDGSTKDTTTGTNSHVYQEAGIYSVTVTAQNTLSAKKRRIQLNLFNRANVTNIKVQANSEVDMNTKFRVTVNMDIVVLSSITVLIDYGDGQQKQIREPTVRTSSPVTVNTDHIYGNGDVYTIWVYVIDNLFWDGHTDIKSLAGQPGVSFVNHTIHAWNIITELSISSSPRCDAVNTPVRFSVGFPSGYNKTGFHFRWSFGDGTVGQNETELDTPIHIYRSAPDLKYQVTLNIQDNTSKGFASYSKCIQQNITSVALTSTKSVYALTAGSSVTARFGVEADGSHLRYEWTYRSGASDVPPSSFSIRHTSAGRHTVQVRVANDISSKDANTTYEVVERISGLELSHSGKTGDHLQTNKTYVFTTSISDGSDITFSWGVSSLTEIVSGTPTTRSLRWTTPGKHIVSVIATNKVSTGKDSTEVTLQDAVVNLSIDQLSTPADVAVNSPIRLQAVVGQATDPTYTWTIQQEFGNVQDVVDRSNGILDTRLSQAGRYIITVTVSNAVSSLSTNISLTAWDYVTSPTIKSGSILNSNWLPKGKPILFEVEFEQGKATVYTWTITKANSQAPITEQNQEKLSWSFLTEDKYTVSVISENPVSTTSVSAEFNIQESIAGLRIQDIQGDIANGNETLSFRSHLTSGTGILYYWEILLPSGTTTDVLSTSHTLAYRFDTIGSYSLNLTAVNYVTTVTETLDVVIQLPPDAAKIAVHFPGDPSETYVHRAVSDCYIHRNKVFESFLEGLDQNNFTYTWRFFDTYPPDVVQGKVAQHRFTELGPFVFEVRVDRPSGLLTVRKFVKIQGRLPPFTFAQFPRLIYTGQEVLFTPLIRGVEQLECVWTIAGGPPVNTTCQPVRYNFTSPGVFQVHVTARNKVSFSSNYVTIIVQDRIAGLDIPVLYYPVGYYVPINATVLIGTNVTYHWQVVKGPADLYRTVGQETLVLYKESGSYTLQITAGNNVSSVVFVKEVFAQQNITNLRLRKEVRAVYVGQTVNYTAVIDSGDNVTFEWHLFNHLLQRGPQSTFTYTFRRAGTSFLTVRASNVISDDVIFRVIPAYTIRCEPMQLSFIGGNRREFKANNMDMEVVVTLNCTRYPLLYMWTLLYDSTCEDESTVVRLPTSVPVTTPQLVVPARTLDYGKYCARFAANYEGTPVLIIASVVLEILHSPLKAIIDGGSKRTFSVSQTIELDGSRSYDPDLPQGKTFGFTYHWTCTPQVT